VVTADAMFTHADVCAAVLGRGAITCCTPRTTSSGCGTTSPRPSTPPTRAAFPPKALADWQADAESAGGRCNGHGRVEERAVTTTTWLNDYLAADWPGVRQAFRLDRRRTEAPRVLASLRNVAVHLLKQRGQPSVAAATREMMAYPGRALALLKDAPSTSE
jgi:hypothetical protein